MKAISSMVIGNYHIRSVHAEEQQWGVIVPGKIRSWQVCRRQKKPYGASPTEAARVPGSRHFDSIASAIVWCREH